MGTAGWFSFIDGVGVFANTTKSAHNTNTGVLLSAEDLRWQNGESG